MPLQVEEIPRLSPSIAHPLLENSPRLAWGKHRLLGAYEEEPSDTVREGTIWHSALLEGSKDIEVLPFDAFRTKEAKLEKARVLAEGKIPVAEPKWEYIQSAVPKILEAMAEVGVIIDGTVEERFEWEEHADNGNVVHCSGYIDHYKGQKLEDLKTDKAAVNEFQASGLVARSHSLYQHAAYTSALAKKIGCYREEVKMRYVFVQIKQPFIVVPLRPSGEFEEVSFLRWRRAINLFEHHLKKGKLKKYWPGPTKGDGRLEIPGWMYADEVARAELAS